MATVVENLEALQKSSDSDTEPRLRQLRTHSLIAGMGRWELEKLVIVMVEGHMHGADAARTMVEEAGW